MTSMKLIVRKYPSPKGIRIYWYSRNVTKVDSVITNSTAPDIPIDVDTFFDTPKNGQMPKNCDKTMLFTKTAAMSMMI